MALLALSFYKGETMTPDYTVCPHCGCRCEDDEYCAACGNLFHEDHVSTRNDSLLGALGSGLRSLKVAKKSRGYSYSHVNDDPDFDPGWAGLSSNIFNHDRHK